MSLGNEVIERWMAVTTVVIERWLVDLKENSVRGILVPKCATYLRRIASRNRESGDPWEEFSDKVDVLIADRFPAHV